MVFGMASIICTIPVVVEGQDASVWWSVSAVALAVIYCVLLIAGNAIELLEDRPWRSG